MCSATPYSAATPYSVMSRGEVGRGFTPVNAMATPGEAWMPKAVTRNGSFSVSSLLTEDREVRLSPKREGRGDDVEMG